MDAAKSAMKFGKVLLGLLIIAAGLFLVLHWWPHFLNVAKGIVGIVIALIGLLVVAIGWAD